MIGPLKPKDLRAHALGPPQEPSASGSCGERSRGGMDELLPKAEAKDMELAATRAPFWRSGRRSTSAISNSGTARKPGTVPPVGRVPFGTRQKEPTRAGKGRQLSRLSTPRPPERATGASVGVRAPLSGGKVDTGEVPSAGSALVPPGRKTCAPKGSPGWV